MTFPWLNQIKWKLTLMTLGTTASVLVLGACAVSIYENANVRRHVLDHVTSMADVVAWNSAAALVFYDKADALSTVMPLVARHDIDYVGLYTDAEAPFVFQSTNGVAPASVEEFYLAGAEHHFDGSQLLLKRRVRLDGDDIGWIVVVANLGEHAAQTRAFLVVLVCSLIALTGVAGLIAVRLQRLVSDPIAELAQAAQQVTVSKDYRVRVTNTSRDEIGALVVAFNEMLLEIERQNDTLVESESRLSMALSASGMGTWQWNTADDTVAWAGQLHPILGCSREGTPLSDYLERVNAKDRDRVWSTLKEAAGAGRHFVLEYRLVTPAGEQVWVAHHGESRRGSADSGGVILGIVQDISDRKQAEAERQELVANLLHAEEDERRRIARELHDTTAQHLAALKMNCKQLCERPGAPMDPNMTRESIELLDQALDEIRTLTYLLHPPLLEQFGLVGALKDLASGMARRSQVDVRLESDGFKGRLSPTVELTLFRVVQESLANAIRHSDTRMVAIRLGCDESSTRVEIQDFGKGFREGAGPRSQPGVGIASMTERLALIGGTLALKSDGQGVTVTAHVPLPPHIESAGPVEVKT